MAFLRFLFSKYFFKHIFYMILIVLFAMLFGIIALRFMTDHGDYVKVPDLKGKTLDSANSIRNVELAEELALPPVKIHCSVLAEDAIKAAITDYKDKQKSDNNIQGCSTNIFPRIPDTFRQLELF